MLLASFTRSSRSTRARSAAALLATATLAVACSESTTEPVTDGLRRSVDVASVVAFDAKNSQISEVQQPGVRIIRSAAEWQQAWADLTARRGRRPRCRLAAGRGRPPAGAAGLPVRWFVGCPGVGC